MSIPMIIPHSSFTTKKAIFEFHLGRDMNALVDYIKFTVDVRNPRKHKIAFYDQSRRILADGTFELPEGFDSEEIYQQDEHTKEGVKVVFCKL